MEITTKLVITMNLEVTEYLDGKLVGKFVSLNLADFIDDWAFYWAIVDAFNNKKVKPC